jgi:hypothetical protein
MPATLTAGDALTPNVGCPEQHFFLSGRLLLPVRLHLANEILLI